MSEELVSMTYTEVDQALMSQEGLFGIRVNVKDDYVAVENFRDNTWSVYNSLVYSDIKLRRIAVREAYKILKAMRIFDLRCEFMAKEKFETNASSIYQREYTKRKREEKREEAIKVKNQSQIPQLKLEIIEMTGFDGETRTKQIQFHNKTYYMYLCDDGISGPLFVSENNEYIKVDNDPEEFSVLKQVLENPWIEMPSHINE